MAKIEKSLRLCPIKHKEVCCDGLCDVVSVDGKARICSVQEKALDLALNC